MDWHDIEEEGLNWGNGIALGLDVVGAAIPFVPSVVGHVRRAGQALSHADDVGGALGGVRAFAHGTSPEHALRMSWVRQ